MILSEGQAESTVQDIENMVRSYIEKVFIYLVFLWPLKFGHLVC